MIKIHSAQSCNFEGAFHGMRTPKESWDKSDSDFFCGFDVGKKDIELAQKLILAGTDHGKFLRQIFVNMDITAPLYWWKEMDTYKVGTTANSTSTMHKLASTPITRECFSFDDNMDKVIVKNNPFSETKNTVSMDDIIDSTINNLESLRQRFNKTKSPEYWRALIQLLPESWNQRRTWTANYQVLRNIYFARRNHKLSEWREFCESLNNLFLGKELIMISSKKEGE